MIWIVCIIGFVLLTIVVGNIIEYRDKKKSKKDYVKDTAVARLNMHNHRFLSQAPFSEGWSVVKLNDFRYAYINDKGEYLGNYLFGRAESFKNGVAIGHIINQGDCILKNDGSFILPPLKNKEKERHIKHLTGKYFLISDHILIKKDTARYEYYIVSKDGLFITQKPFDKYLDFEGGVFRVQTGKLISEIDEEGNLLNPPFSKKIELGDGLYKVMQTQYQWGVYDSKVKEIIIPCVFSDLFYIPQYQTLIVREYPDGNKLVRYSVLDLEGNTILSTVSGTIDFWGDKYYRIIKHRDGGRHPLMGLYSDEGKVVVQPNFQHIWVKENHFFVSSDGKRCGKVNQLGYSSLEYDKYKTVNLTEWDFPVKTFPSHISNSDCSTQFICNPSSLIVCKDNKYGVVDITGDIIIPSIYDNIDIIEGENNSAGCYLIKLNHQFGVADLNGNITIPIEYEEIKSKIDFGTDEFVARYSFNSYNETNVEAEMEEFVREMECSKGKPRYLILIKNGIKSCVSFQGDPYIPKPTKQELRLRSYSTQIPQIRNYVKEEQEIVSTKNNHPQQSPKNFLLFFDTETTGLPKNYYAPKTAVDNWPRLVQLSWLVVDEDYNIISERDIIIRPDNFVIPESSSNLHGITTERAQKSGIGLEEALTMFIEDVKRVKICVGHNLEFDKKIIGCELYRMNMNDVLTSKPSVCTMQSTVNLCRIPGNFGYKYPKLQELYNHLFGLTFNDAHNSLADVKATFQCYKELKSRNLI